MIFREIGKSKLSYESWVTFIISVLIEVTLLLINTIYVFIRKGPYKIFYFLRPLLSCCFFNGEYFGIPLVQYIFGDEYVHVAVYTYIVHSVIVHPIANILIYKYNNPVGTTSEESSSKNEEEEEPLEDGIDKGDPEDHIDIDLESEDSEKSESEKDKNQRQPLWKAILFSFLTPQNVGIILGLIWSAIGWTMPTIIDTFTQDHQKALYAAGLFVSGGLLYEHPFLGFHAVETLPYILIKTIAVPLISVLWGLAFGRSKTERAIITMMYASPMGLDAFSLCYNKLKMKMDSPTFTFVWTNLVSIPVSLLWIFVYDI
ncbi:Auxin Efflux Carrier family protein [Histomonas meleagridis]|uniref:Auxin Efflux Carrier family protein n=1 Tax=Histomonas meleagridis TaxID=135588 RepID=UPI0035594EF8|nr:Auxin Efflux Carrier family protein [Histomonas meleagridis]KAH0804013.1 Auxin Efflux Carrier family protein [Histomonas meleagridis]